MFALFVCGNTDNTVHVNTGFSNIVQTYRNLSLSLHQISQFRSYVRNITATTNTLFRCHFHLFQVQSIIYYTTTPTPLSPCLFGSSLFYASVVFCCLFTLSSGITSWNFYNNTEGLQACSWAKDEREMVIGKSRLLMREVGRIIIVKEEEISWDWSRE